MTSVTFVQAKSVSILLIEIGVQLSGLLRSAHRVCGRFDMTAEVGQAFEQALDGLVGVVAAEVIGSEVGVFDAIAQHVGAS